MSYPYSAPVDITLYFYDVFDLVYPDHAHDAETLLVDPETGDLYIVTKESDGRSGVYYAPAPSDGETIELQLAASVRFGAGELSGSALATGGDVSADGRRVLIRTYNRSFVFNRPTGASPARAFESSPCAVPVASERQGESIAFAPDGIGFYTISEGINAPIDYTECSGQ